MRKSLLLSIQIMLLPLFLSAQKGPGLGNLQYTSEELFKSIWLYVDPTHFGSNAITMVNGYLVMTFTPDSGRPPGGLLVFDVSNPRVPKLVKRVYDDRTSTLRECHAIGQHGNYIVIQDGCGIQIWDLSNGNDPVLVKKFCIEGYGHDDYGSSWQIFWQAPYIYIGNGSAGLDVVDASDVRNPVFVKHVSIGMQAGPIFAIGNLLVTTAHNEGRGIALLDISNPRDPKLLNTSSGAEKMYAASVNGNRVITSARGNFDNSTFSVHDISDPLNITLGGRLTIGNSSDQLYNATQDEFIFQGCQSEIVKIDATDVANMKIAGRGRLNIDGDTDHGQVTPMGNLVFVGNDHGSGNGFIVHQLAPDTKGPEVNMVSPSPSTLNRALTSRIGITCTDNVDISTVNNSTFIVRPLGGQAISGKYSHQTTIVNFSPDQPLLANTVYEILVPKGGIKDWAGNPSTKDFISYFSTGSTAEFKPDRVNYFSLTEYSEKVALKWGKASSATKYNIKRSNDPLGPFTKIGTTTELTYEDVDVISGNVYYYMITAENSFGEGNNSVVKKAVPVFYLTDLNWTSSENGWGPVEKDQSNGEEEINDGSVITLNGVTYSRGLGMHAPGRVVYNLDGKFKRFVSDIGIDDEVSSYGLVVFKVLLDGKEVYNSGPMTSQSSTKTIDIDVLNAKELELILSDEGDIGMDHASWGGAKLFPIKAITNNEEELSSLQRISISPNPATDELHIQSHSEIQSTIITNMYGVVVYENHTTFKGTKTINLHGIQKGIHLMSLKRGDKVDIIKIIVQ